MLAAIGGCTLSDSLSRPTRYRKQGPPKPPPIRGMRCRSTRPPTKTARLRPRPPRSRHRSGRPAAAAARKVRPSPAAALRSGRGRARTRGRLPRIRRDRSRRERQAGAPRLPAKASRSPRRARPRTPRTPARVGRHRPLHARDRGAGRAPSARCLRNWRSPRFATASSFATPPTSRSTTSCADISRPPDTARTPSSSTCGTSSTAPARCCIASRTRSRCPAGIGQAMGLGPGSDDEGRGAQDDLRLPGVAEQAGGMSAQDSWRNSLVRRAIAAASILQSRRSQLKAPQ